MIAPILSSKLIIKVLNYELQILQSPFEKVYLPIWERLPHRNSFLSKEDLSGPEVYYPLKVYVCDSCFLVQVAEYKKRMKFLIKNYVYFHLIPVRGWNMLKIMYTTSINDLDILRVHLSLKLHRMMDTLQYFKELKIPVLGIEPTFSTAELLVQRNRKPGWIFGVSVAKNWYVKTNKLIYWLATMFSRMYRFTWFCGRIKKSRSNQTVSWQWNSLICFN